MNYCLQGDDSVTECIMQDGKVKIQQSFNHGIDNRYLDNVTTFFQICQLTVCLFFHGSAVLLLFCFVLFCFVLFFAARLCGWLFSFMGFCFYKLITVGVLPTLIVRLQKGGYFEACIWNFLALVVICNAFALGVKCCNRTEQCFWKTSNLVS